MYILGSPLIDPYYINRKQMVINNNTFTNMNRFFAYITSEEYKKQLKKNDITDIFEYITDICKFFESIDTIQMDHLTKIDNEIKLIEQGLEKRIKHTKKMNKRKIRKFESKYKNIKRKFNPRSIPMEYYYQRNINKIIEEFEEIKKIRDYLDTHCKNWDCYSHEQNYKKYNELKQQFEELKKTKTYTLMKLNKKI